MCRKKLKIFWRGREVVSVKRQRRLQVLPPSKAGLSARRAKPVLADLLWKVSSDGRPRGDRSPSKLFRVMVCAR
jgi:hypothetical protein